MNRLFVRSVGDGDVTFIGTCFISMRVRDSQNLRTVGVYITELVRCYGKTRVIACNSQWSNVTPVQQRSHGYLTRINNSTSEIHFCRIRILQIFQLRNADVGVRVGEVTRVVETNKTCRFGELDISRRVSVFIRRIIVGPNRCPICTIRTLFDVEHMRVAVTFFRIAHPKQSSLSKTTQLIKTERRVTNIGLCRINVRIIKRQFIRYTRKRQRLVFVRPIGRASTTNGV